MTSHSDYFQGQVLNGTEIIFWEILLVSLFVGLVKAIVHEVYIWQAFYYIKLQW